MKQGIIFEIEEFAINDGPGIRTAIFLKGCPLHCAWCHNPEGISPNPQYMDKKNGKEICGYTISIDELSQKILRNKEIFKLNHGGVTFSGGEPMYQSDFLLEVLHQIKGEVHAAIETSGFTSHEIFKNVVSMLDLVLFDVKQTNPELHKKYTGVSNQPILDNLNYLCHEADKDFIIRVPLIPGVNDTKENMLTLLDLIKDAKRLVRIELLRYNKMAGAKYPMIGQNYNPPFDPTIEPHIYNVFEKNNIKTLIL